MDRINLATISGALLVSISFAAMLGWILNIPQLSSIFPNQINLTFNSALCFCLVGCSLIAGNSKQKFFQIKFPAMVGICILTIAILSIFESTFNLSLGIDTIFVRASDITQDPFSGRMAFFNAIAFILAGITLMLMAFTKNRLVAILIQILIFCIFLSSISAFLGYLLKLEFLYEWSRYNYSLMAIQSTINLILMGLGLAFYWSKHENCAYFYKDKEDWRIMITASAILFCAVYVAGFLGFSLIAKDNETLLKRNLERSLMIRTSFFQQSIDRSLKHFNSLINYTQRMLVTKKNNKEMLLADSETDFSAIAIYDQNKQIIYKSGNFVADPSMSAPLNLPYTGTLLWKNGWFVQYTYPFPKNNQGLAQLKAEWPLTEVTQLFMLYQGLGKTGEYLVCTPARDNKATCFPSRLNPKPFTVNYFADKKTPRAIFFALNNERGIKNSIDYRNKLVIAAFGPLNELGLGLVSKIDSAEIYESITKQLRQVLIILLFTIIAGILAIYWQLNPLLQRVLLSEKRAYESEERFHSAFDYAAIGKALVGIDGRWLKVNRALTTITGYTEEELLKMDFQTITYPPDLDKDLSYVQNLLDNKMQFYEMEKRFYHKKGYLIWILLSMSLVRDNNGLPLYFISQIQNIDKQKQAEEQLTYQAFHDPLTGLFNRAQLEYHTNAALAAAKRHQKKLAVIYLDLDQFKIINDLYGHDAGDLVLKHVAKCLQSCLRKTDFVARLGGDEFAAVITEVNEIQDVIVPVEKIIKAMAYPFDIKNQQVATAVSIGISIYPDDGDDYQTLLKRADQALYKAKHNTRKKYQFYGIDYTD